MQQALKKVSNGYEYAEEYVYRRAGNVNRPLEKEKPQPQPRLQPQKQYKKVEVKYVVHPANRLKRQSMILNCLTIGICFILLIGVVSSYAKISSLNLENIAIEENIDELEAEVEQKELELSIKCNVQTITSVASEELEMGFPSASQVEKIQFVDRGVTGGEETGQNRGWFSEFMDDLVGLLR